MRAAYEDVRVAPHGELTTELMSCSLESALGKNTGSEDPSSVERYAPTQTPTLLATQGTDKPAHQKKGPRDDVGPYAHTVSQSAGNITTELQSDRTHIMSEIYDMIGSKQVTGNKLAFAPPWPLEEAFQKEHDSNWVEAYANFNDYEIPRDANVINSHVVYKVETQEDGSRAMKARIVPHGNRDEEKDDIRKDSSIAQLNIIHLLLSLVTFLGFRLATADIKGAYLQSGPIQRDMFVRPPRKCRGPRKTIWKLLKLPYGIVQAGRQWQKTVEEWLLNKAGLERTFGLSQLFTQRDRTGRIILLVAKVTDDFLLRGSIEEMKYFLVKLHKRFIVGKVLVNSLFHFNGYEIEQYCEGNIKRSMIRYMEHIKAIALSRTRRKQVNERATVSEVKQFRSLACTLLYLGSGVLPQESFATSTLQQMISQLIVASLITANEMLKELLALSPWITLRRPTNIREVFVCTFSDASFNQNSDKDYGQSGVITGLRIVTDKALDTYHAIDWSSHKQRKVSYSSYGAEILACADGDDRVFLSEDCPKFNFRDLRHSQ